MAKTAEKVYCLTEKNLREFQGLLSEVWFYCMTQRDPDSVETRSPLTLQEVETLANSGIELLDGLAELDQAAR
jgi:hypothetical protein